MTKIINEFEIFKLSSKDKVKIDKTVIGDTDIPCIVIDNFYEDIEKVREFANSLPYTKSQYICNSSPGKRVRLELDIREIQKIAINLLEVPNWLLIDVEPRVIFNKMRSDDVLSANQTNPHVDTHRGHSVNFNVAMVGYLNKPEECSGGTGFYRHKGTGIFDVKNKHQASNVINYFEGKTTNYGKFMSESNEDWELIDLIEMKSNRAIFYPSNVFHSPYITEGDFTEYDRFTQLGFF